MKILSLFLFLAIPILNSIHAQSKIQESIDRFAADASMQNASISFMVLDLTTGNTVAEFHPDLALPTASTAKLFSTATAMDILGAEYRPVTRIYSDGQIDSNGVLHGNLWIRGGGDPSLGSKYFNQAGHQLDFLSSWIAAIQKAGIRAIDGTVYGDASEFGYQGAPDGWNWSDLGNYYGAGPSGLTIYDNLQTYTFSVPSTPGALTKILSIEPEVPGMVFHNYVEASSKSGDNAYLFGAPYSLDRFGTGTLPAGSSSFVVKGSLPDPEWQVAWELKKALENTGITVKEEARSVRRNDLPRSAKRYDNMRLLHTHQGERLADIARETNHQSINLFAEHMISLVGFVKTGDGGTYSGLEVLENYWKDKFNTSGMYVTDGSGLSRSNGISARHFTQMLRYMYQSKGSAQFISTLPIAGQSGTMRNVCAGGAAQNRMKAKSGSMQRIRSYAGYIQSSTGKEYCFALIVNNANCSSAALRSKMESVFNTIAVN